MFLTASSTSYLFLKTWVKQKRYNEGIIPDNSDLFDRSILAEQLFEVSLTTIFSETSHINLWITHELYILKYIILQKKFILVIDKL
jgi:hypothetical protein